MNFSKIQYTRPDMQQITADMNGLLAKFAAAQSAAAQVESVNVINAIRKTFESMGSLCFIRHMIDTTDQFYKDEQAWFDENTPFMEELIDKYYQALLKSEQRVGLEALLGKQLFNLVECKLKTFKPEIISLLQQENKLASEYSQITASAQIEFDGKTLNLPQLVPYMESPDRALRKAANEARYSFFSANTAKLDELYDRLVHIRHEIALQLGFENFIPVAYARMSRSDYGAVEVAAFRKQVETAVVPLGERQREWQRARLNVEELRYYDVRVEFTDGNPKPQGEEQWIVERARQMYSELSPQTAEFFGFMLENQLLDLTSRPGKAPGGFCSYLHDSKTPFIYANYNGTMHDVNVLTHEAGHAFAAWNSSGYELPEYLGGTAEVCEIHSMSMEYFAWPWMQNFFGSDSAKFYFHHMNDNLCGILYLTAVDEFQHEVYANPDWTPQQRKQCWRAIERKYMPYLNYEGNEFLENGGYWQQQMHIFLIPFYYIDYALAQICAFQFWQQANQNREQAWNNYLALCRAGGSKPMCELLEIAGLQSPFADGCVAAVVKDVGEWLEGNRM